MLQVVLIEIKLANYLFNVNINFISHQQDLGIYFAMALNDHTGMIKRQIVNEANLALHIQITNV